MTKSRHTYQPGDRVRLCEELGKGTVVDVLGVTLVIELDDGTDIVVLAVEVEPLNVVEKLADLA